jgi:hypothetical protein
MPKEILQHQEIEDRATNSAKEDTKDQNIDFSKNYDPMIPIKDHELGIAAYHRS